MSAATDIILAAGPSVVALAAIGGTVWQQRRGFRHERAMADRADTRAVLDDAAQALHDADYARYAVSEVGPEAVTSTILAQLDKAGAAMDAIGARLAFRLGVDHDVVEHFRRATDALLTLRREVASPSG